MWACFIIPCCLFGSVFSFLVRLCRHAPWNTFAPLSQKHDSTSWPQKNEPNKCAWEKQFRGRSCVLASSLTVFRWVFIFLSSHTAPRHDAREPWKSQNPTGPLPKQTKGHLRETPTTTQLRQNITPHIALSFAFLQSISLYLLSLSPFFLLYSHHATSIRDWSQHHFLCGCSLLSSCQRATRAADD